MVLVVVVPSLNARPHASLHGAGLVVSLCLIVLTAAFGVVVIGAEWIEQGRSRVPSTIALVAMAVVGVILTAEQPTGTGELAQGLVAYVAGARVAALPGVALVVATAVGTSIARVSAAGQSVTTVTSTVLLAALLYLMARLFRRAQEDRQRAELATAELEDARERELESAALTERSRIARELHDVLAHSLSGLALQLEAARLTARQAGASEQLVELLGRCRAMAAQGLEEARSAVRALRGQEVPGLDSLRGLVEGFRERGMDVRLTIHGEPAGLAPEASLALYRAAQEALTNVTRHSAAEVVTVEVELGERTARLVVADDGGAGVATRVLAGVGSGYGLHAMRERAELLGGRVEAGPHAGGFRVELELPRGGPAE